MNRRRMMMLQQRNGFELVYDAASGLLPTECGWQITQSGSQSSLTVVNGMLNVVSNTDLHLTLDINQTFENCYIEIEYVVQAAQGVSIVMTSTEPSVAMGMSPYSENGVTVYQQWSNPLVKIPAIQIGTNYIAKLEKRGNFVSAYLNNEIIYSGEISGHYASYFRDIIGFNTGALLTPIYVKRIIYKGY